MLRGVLLTGRGQQWVRRDLSEEEGSAERHALWWPPTKVAGRYLAPFLASLEQRREGATDEKPRGQIVELDAVRDVPAVADAMADARERASGG